MDFQLTDEQKMIVETATKVGREFGLEYWAKQDEAKAFPRECWQAICDAGLGGASLPEAYGGAGLGMVEVALIVEALSAGGAGATLGQLFMINPIFGGVSVSRFGNDAMKQEILPALISGKINTCMALTEPDAGTNTLALKTFAREDGDGWRINGRKIWITAADTAEKMLVIARTQKAEEVAKPTQAIGAGDQAPQQRRATTPAKAGEKVGRNSPCPCGSGKKYKHCHGKNAAAGDEQ